MGQCFGDTQDLISFVLVCFCLLLLAFIACLAALTTATEPVRFCFAQKGKAKMQKRKIVRQPRLKN